MFAHYGYTQSMISDIRGGGSSQKCRQDRRQPWENPKFDAGNIDIDVNNTD